MLNVVLFSYSSLRIDCKAVYNGLERSFNSNEPCMFLFVFDKKLSSVPLLSGSDFFLQNALIYLRDEIYKEFSAPLVVVESDLMDFLLELSSKYSQVNIFTSNIYEPNYLNFYKDTANKNIKVMMNFYNDSLMLSPKRIFNKLGNPFKVFTHYYNHIKSVGLKVNLLKIDTKKYLSVQFVDFEYPNKKLIKNNDAKFAIDSNIVDTLRDFLHNKLLKYKENRDYPFLNHTSLISRYLRFGLISPFKVLDEVLKFSPLGIEDFFVRELIWREFAYYITYHYPYVIYNDFKPDVYKSFIWNDELQFIHRFESGDTGYPLIDAGIKQLITTGNMHNRVRMCVASFCVKNLQLPWQVGANFFMKHLIDADIIINSFSWQWVAGCGVDSAPYFRIFNPLLQNQKFDENCEYVKQYLPNLKHLSNKEIFKLYESKDAIVNFKESRLLFLEKMKL